MTAAILFAAAMACVLAAVFCIRRDIRAATTKDREALRAYLIDGRSYWWRLFVVFVATTLVLLMAMLIVAFN